MIGTKSFLSLLGGGFAEGWEGVRWGWGVGPGAREGEGRMGEREFLRYRMELLSVFLFSDVMPSLSEKYQLEIVDLIGFRRCSCSIVCLCVKLREGGGRGEGGRVE